MVSAERIYAAVVRKGFENKGKKDPAKERRKRRGGWSLQQVEEIEEGSRSQRGAGLTGKSRGRETTRNDATRDNAIV
jgi:hypothetical protein